MYQKFLSGVANRSLRPHHNLKNVGSNPRQGTFKIFKASPTRRCPPYTVVFHGRCAIFDQMSSHLM
jgi:hypothetical protein